MFARSEAAFARGNLPAARAALIAILPHTGEHPAVLHLLALVEKRSDRKQAAADAFVRALRAAPRDAQIHGNYANLLDDLGRLDEALLHYDRAIAAAPSVADTRVNRALLLQRLKRPAEALAELDQAARLARPGARLHTARGLVLRELEQLDDAAAAFDAALAIEPARAAALVGRARVALERGEADAAARYGAALAVRQGDVELRLGEALALEAGGAAAASTLLADTVAAMPTWAEGHAQLARMRSEEADGDDPTRSFRAALARHPRDAGLNAAYWQTLIRAERFADLLGAIDTARGHLPDDRSMLVAEAIGASETGDNSRAETVFQRLDPGADINLAQARHRLRTGDPERAAAILQEMVTDAPGDIGAWAHLLLAWRLLDDDRQHWLAGQPGLYRAVELELSATELEDLANLLRTLHRTRAHPIGQSLRGGTQTRGRLFARLEPELRRMKARIEAAVRAHVAAMPPRDDGHPLLRYRDATFALAGSWSVRLRESGFHVNHIHPEGLFSSACYIALPESIGGEGGRDGWLDLGSPPVELGLALDPIASIEPRPGRLALFPSYLFHGTRPFRGGERLTIAFDVRADQTG